MTTLIAPNRFQLNLHAHDAPRGWWSRRPWAHSLPLIDTTAFEPGRPRGVPLVAGARSRRARRAPTDLSLVRTAPAPVDRRGLDGPGAAYRSWQVPVTLKLVDEDEAARLERARHEIAFRPRNGFLHSTPVGPLVRAD